MSPVIHSGGFGYQKAYLIISTLLLAVHFCGEKSFAKALGLFVSVNTAGYAVGAPLLNLCFDITGNYNIGLYASCAVIIAVFVSMNLILNAAKRHRKEIEKRN